MTASQRLARARTAYPVGKAVRYFPPDREKGEPEFYRRLIRARPVFSGTRIVVRITGPNGDIDIAHLREGWFDD